MTYTSFIVPATSPEPRPEPQPLPLGELVRYTIASAAALSLDFSTLVLCTSVLKIHYLLSAALGFSIGVATVYLMSIRWVFSHRRCTNRVAEFTRFLAIGVAGLGLNELIMWGATDVGGLHYQYSKVIAAGVVFVFNFLLRKLFLFTPTETAQATAQ